jgi:hypothetical protein
MSVDEMSVDKMKWRTEIGQSLETSKLFLIAFEKN